MNDKEATAVTWRRSTDWWLMHGVPVTFTYANGSACLAVVHKENWPRTGKEPLVTPYMKR